MRIVSCGTLVDPSCGRKKLFPDEQPDSMSGWCRGSVTFYVLFLLHLALVLDWHRDCQHACYVKTGNSWGVTSFSSRMGFSWRRRSVGRSSSTPSKMPGGQRKEAAIAAVTATNTVAAVAVTDTDTDTVTAVAVTATVTAVAVTASDTVALSVGVGCCSFQ